MDESFLFLLKGDVLMQRILDLWYMGTDLSFSTNRVPDAIGLIACRERVHVLYMINPAVCIGLIEINLYGSIYMGLITQRSAPRLDKSSSLGSILSFI